MINIAKYIFGLGAHVLHMPNVLGICDVMSIWSWAHVIFGLDSCNAYCLVRAYIGHMYGHMYA